jgi:predicted RNase H-like nuclease (RuvC/YqgF family)
MLISSKQSDIYYLSPFIQLSNVTHENTNQNFMLTDSDVIQAKIGYINPLLLSDDDTKDDDASYAYNKQSLETQSKLRNFCKSRYDTISASQEENYELLSNVEKNNNRISQLKDVLDNIIKYDPEKQKIQESYPNLYPVNSLE